MQVQKIDNVGRHAGSPTEKDLEGQKYACANRREPGEAGRRIANHRGPRPLIENIYSMQIGTLVTMHVLCYENVAFMKLANASEKVKNLLRMVGLEAMMEIHHGVDVALQSFGKDKKVTHGRTMAVPASPETHSGRARSFGAAVASRPVRNRCCGGWFCFVKDRTCRRACCSSVLSTRLTESARRTICIAMFSSNHAPEPVERRTVHAFSTADVPGSAAGADAAAATGTVASTYWNALRLTYLGAFFDTFMVTSVGGDAVKAVYIAREAPPGGRSKPSASSSSTACSACSDCSR